MPKFNLNVALGTLIVVLLNLPLSAQISGSTQLTITNNVVLWNTTHQTIDGFGGAHALGFNENDTSAQSALLFTTNNGIGLTFQRMLTSPDDEFDSIATAQLAASNGALVWVASMSPPAGWKTNNSLTDGGYLCDGTNGCGGVNHYQDYANYLVTFIQTYASSYGINLYGISIQNEPDQVVSYQSCQWTDTQLDNFIKNYLGPSLSRAGLKTKIIMPEPSCWGCLSSYDDTTMNDSAAAAYVSILAAHQYDYAYDAQNTYGKRLWETEVSDFNPTDLSITDGLNYAALVHNSLTLANVNAWHWWALVHSTPDNQCLICSGTPAKRLYTLGNFSKFVRPGWVRIDVQANFGGVLFSAFKNPSTGAFAIIAINTNASATRISLTLSGFTSSNLIPTITSATQDLVSLSALTAGAGFTYTLPAESVVTFTGTNGT
jgi:glucuronoarabinoxylan endo-1,4-beta-xylanase